ncbi:MAG: PQQ-like beta-propeller repeat protein [Planctomycetia bacterium]|nr:PQQ-like beta-propeller repeat protein [Planctomycetia bacterium]
MKKQSAGPSAERSLIQRLKFGSTLALGTLLCCATSACAQATAPAGAPEKPVGTATLPTETRPAVSTAGQGEDWSQWRGPRSNGIALRTSLPSTWPSAPLEPVWRMPLGEGWSSPVVGEGRVYMLDRNGPLERAAAYDAVTGKLLWERTNPVDFNPHAVGRRYGNGPKGTPAFAGGFVYTLGIAGWLQCLKAESGEVVWKSYFPAEFAESVPLADQRTYVVAEDHVVVPIGGGRGAPVPLFGYTGSPLVFDQFVIASTGGARGGTITAFERTTGKVAWHALHENVSYSSPVSAEIGGVKQVVVPTGPRLVGLELATGKLLWSVPYQNQYDETIGTPVAAGELVLLTAVGRPLSAWKIGRNAAGEFAASEVWQNDDLQSYLSSVVVVGEFVYGMNDGGEWHCLKLADGKTIWRGGNHGYYTTPLVAENRILALNERGVLDVLGVNPQAYEPIVTTRVAKEPTWTSPALVGNRLYVRMRSALVCYELK